MLEECKKAYEDRDYSKLARLCEEILKKDENNQKALTYLMYAYCDFGQYNLVLRTADKIRRLNPKNSHPYNCEAMVHLVRGEYKNALLLADEGLKIAESQNLKKTRIEALISLKRFDEAYEFFKSQNIPDYNFTNALIRCGKYSQIPKYRSDLSDKELLGYLFERCRYLERKGTPSEILEVCGEIFKIDENNEYALEYKIYALACLEKYSEVLRCCDAGIKLHPSNFRFYFEKGETLLWEFEDFDASAEYYEKGFAFVDDVNSRWHDLNNLTEALFKKAEKTADLDEKAGIYDKILYYKPREFEALDKLNALMDEEDVSYEPGENYSVSSELKEILDEKSRKTDEWLSSIEIGDYDRDYVESLSKFRNYNSIDEYVRDIIICLIESYPGHSKKQAQFLVKCHLPYIKDSYECREPAGYCSIEVGYCCG